jgi:SAM-dependent methyltransferase
VRHFHEKREVAHVPITGGTAPLFTRCDILQVMRRMEEESVSFGSADLGVFQLIARGNFDVKAAAERIVRQSAPALEEYLMRLLPHPRCSSLSLMDLARGPGDIRTITLPGDLDVITLFNTIHGLEKQELFELTGKIYRALNPGGRLAIHDFYLRDNPREPVEKILFDIKLAREAKAGELFHPSDFQELQSVGFREFQLFPIDDENIPVKNSAFFIYYK